MTFPRILVVHHRSKYPRLSSKRTDPTVGRLVDANDPIVATIVEAHQNHTESLAAIENSMARMGIAATWRTNINNISVDAFDLVVTVGGDGTVLHASHSIGSTPVLGVNSSPSTSFGFFTCATAATFESVLRAALEKKLSTVTLHRMEILVDDKIVTNRALNDALFCHDCPASTTRYTLTYNCTVEDHLSSGVWVSTAAGSTAAIRAVGGKAMPPGSRRLQFAVREPFAGGSQSRAGRKSKLISGFIPDQGALTIRSKTVAARLYVDGPHVVFPVEFGQTVVFRRSAQPLRIFRSSAK